MKINNTKLYLLIGLLLGTADANADACTASQTTNNCKNLTVEYDKNDAGGEWMTAIYTPCQPANPDDKLSPLVPNEGATYCVEHNTTIDIHPHSTACKWTPERNISNGLVVTCVGACGGSNSGCDVVELPPSGKTSAPAKKPVKKK